MKFHVLVTSGCLVRARPAEAGERFALGAQDALDLVASGRGEFIDPADHKRAAAQIYAELAQANPHAAWTKLSVVGGGRP